MKRILTALLCLSVLALLLTGCTDNNTEEPSDTPCTHSYTDGKCIHCNAADPSYNAGGENGDKEEGGEDTEGEKDPADTDIPDIELDGEVELPFVPAN